MNSNTATLIGDVITIVVCIFTLGQTWGATKGRFKGIEDRLSRIEDMFVLVLKSEKKS